MITIAQSIRRGFIRYNGKYRVWLTLAVLAIIAGCSNSKLLLSPLYNRLDDQIRKEFHKLGDFNEDQVNAFEQRLGTFHVWHRQSELPQYAALMQDIGQSIATRENINQETVDQWFDTAEQHSKAVRECHPINFSYDLVKTLTDEQVNFIQRRFARERRRNQERYHSRTPEERIERRHANVIKWAGRLNFEFTEKQKLMLKQTLQEQVSLRKEYYKLSSRWNQKLFAMARNQSSPTYNADMHKHVQSLWSLLEDGYTSEWDSNRRLWKNFALQFEQSLTFDQRKQASIWITQLASTLDAISKNKPSFSVGNDSSIGCLVEKA
jgi:hypothetical protein